MRATPTLPRFLSKIAIQPDGCWAWLGHLERGYGRFFVNRRQVRPHRFAYIYFTDEPVPEGYELDHLCRNRSCVNPYHLQVLRHVDNLHRGIGGQLAAERQLRKTHCPKGHPYDERNTYIPPNGQRVCRTCRNIARAKLKRVGR